MLDKETVALVNFRLDQARVCLEDARRSLECLSFKTSVNRSYYCIFHAIRAVLAVERFDSKKHSGVISHFRSNYIKVGKFPSILSDIVKDAFKYRNDCDYMDFYVISKDDTTAQVENAKVFLNAVEEYLERTVPEIKDITENNICPKKLFSQK